MVLGVRGGFRERPRRRCTAGRWRSARWCIEAIASLRLQTDARQLRPRSHPSGRTKLHQGEVECLGGQHGLNLELLGRIPPSRKVLEEGVPQRLGRARDVVRRRIGVELVQAELDDAVDELFVSRRAGQPSQGEGGGTLAYLRVEDG